MNLRSFCDIPVVSYFAGRIKELLEAQLNVPVAKQELRGWVNKNDRNMSNSVGILTEQRRENVFCCDYFVVLMCATVTLPQTLRRDFRLKFHSLLCAGFVTRLETAKGKLAILTDTGAKAFRGNKRSRVSGSQ